MLAHLIHYKGKGGWVFILPLLSAFILFLLFDGLDLDDNYVGALSLVISGTILFLIDHRGKRVIQGELIQTIVRLPRERNKNTFMWIEARYWGMLMVVIGVVWLVDLAGA